jgi:mono/diheme cytochrome c family protein
MNFKYLYGAAIAVFVGVIYFSFIKPDDIDYNTQVKPILNKKCIACHGGVKKNGGFSLLFEEEAKGNTKSGHPAIIPGDADESEFIKRLTHKDPDKRMPKKGSPLTEEEINILKKWVNQGAKWGKHWAYKTVEKPDVPKPFWSFLTESWTKNDVDYFIKDKFSEVGLSNSKQADKSTLLRRVYLDLTGLPPTAQQYEAFVKDNSENAYEKIVDELLKSSAYGEKWTSMWLDLARYADSRGYEKDNLRSVWRYRDWVIKAFNEDKPYDKFITEQLAGDLLPNRTEDQIIATVFHRNTLNNDEGGTDDEEFRIAEVMDRVNTNWTAISSTTFNCVQCHAHPYDPFKHDDYYKQMAFFNNTQDADIDDDSSFLRYFSSEDSTKLVDLKNWISTHASKQKADETVQFLRTLGPMIPFPRFDKIENGLYDNSIGVTLKNNGSTRLPNAPFYGRTKVILNLNYYFKSKPKTIVELHLDSLNGQQIGMVKIDTSAKIKLHTIDIPKIEGTRDLYVVVKNPTIAKGSTEIVTRLYWITFRNDDLMPKINHPDFVKYQKTFTELLYAHTDNLPVMAENPNDMKRTTRVFERGAFGNPTTPVEPDVPQSLNPFPKNAPRNRLGLSMWLTDKANPLTSRTMVNRLWEQVFGTGLVETLEDLGSQGFSPTHPELLDYLSYKFMHDYKWQIKPLLKEIVMSATYQQDSHTTKEQLEKDPSNKYLARGVRMRLSAEQIRDEALAVSGLLSRKMYGKSVMPYQPAGLWQTVYSGHKWVTSKGEDAYRRAVYTLIRRSSPYPNMLNFDGTSREVCLARRIRTNTPLQALAMLNDSAYVEMAQKFALKMQKEGGKDLNQQLKKGYWMMMGKELPTKKALIFSNLYKEALTRFRKEPTKLKDWIGEQKEETAALAVVANMMLNMDEFIVKE